MTRRVGLVGAGFVGRPLARHFDGTEGFAVRAVADPDAEARTRTIEALSIPEERAYDRYERMLDDVELDALLVATPPRLREGVLTAALDREVDVFCEKPLAVDVATARRVADAVRSGDGTVVLGYQRRLHPGYLQCRAAIRDGSPESLTVDGYVGLDWASGLEGTWKVDPDVPGSGFLADTATHLVDALLWVGDVVPEAVSAELVDSLAHGVDVRGSITIRGTDDEVVSLSFDGHAARARERVVLASDATCCTVERPEWVTDGDMVGDYDEESFAVDVRPPGRARDPPRFAGETKADAFRRALDGDDTPLATVDDGVTEARVREAATRSAERGTRVRLDSI